jgi:hypothetical protein
VEFVTLDTLDHLSLCLHDFSMSMKSLITVYFVQLVVLLLFKLKKGLVAITPGAGIIWHSIFYFFRLVYFCVITGFVQSHYAIIIGIVGKNYSIKFIKKLFTQVIMLDPKSNQTSEILLGLA